MSEEWSPLFRQQSRFHDCLQLVISFQKGNPPRCWETTKLRRNETKKTRNSTVQRHDAFKPKRVQVLVNGAELGSKINRRVYADLRQAALKTNTVNKKKRKFPTNSVSRWSRARCDPSRVLPSIYWVFFSNKVSQLQHFRVILIFPLFRGGGGLWFFLDASHFLWFRGGRLSRFEAVRGKYFGGLRVICYVFIDSAGRCKQMGHETALGMRTTREREEKLSAKSIPWRSAFHKAVAILGAT